VICADVRELEARFVFHWQCQVEPRCQAEPRASVKIHVYVYNWCIQRLARGLGPLAARSEYLTHRLVVSDVQLRSAPCEGDAQDTGGTWQKGKCWSDNVTAMT
jgi:hypothetical protein